MNGLILSLSILAFLCSIVSLVASLRVYIAVSAARLRHANLHFVPVDQEGMDAKEIERHLSAVDEFI